MIHLTLGKWSGMKSISSRLMNYRVKCSVWFIQDWFILSANFKFALISFDHGVLLSVVKFLREEQKIIGFIDKLAWLIPPKWGGGMILLHITLHHGS